MQACRRGGVHVTVGKIRTEVQFLWNASRSGRTNPLQLGKIFDFPGVRFYRGETSVQVEDFGIGSYSGVQNCRPKAAFDESDCGRNAAET